MEKPIYKLSSVLLGHTSDVRAIASFADGTIVSASRDKTARIWKPTGDGKSYASTSTLTGHNNFVSSVCVLNPSVKHPEGLIVTGGNDSKICIYTPDKTEPLKTIDAHQNTVCKLRTGKEKETFLSSSWDMSAKLWSTNDLSSPKLTLVGHTAAVWCVADLENGLIVTGSADKMVVVWTRDGCVHHRLQGHTDCVRDITSIKEAEFLTCANDATVKHWNATTGTCLGTYCGHRNYIYSIVAMPGGSSVFTSGEDRTMMVWCSGNLYQTINFPTQSVWCLDLLPNGDVVTGSSDGEIRIFSADSQRIASPELLAKFEKEVAETKLNAEQELGGIKIKDLPDASVLKQPGQKDGQTKIVHEGDAVHAYSWSENERRWVRIGDVMGASGGSTATSGKQLYNGIEYDYIFSVDIQDGVPPLKLPYNRGQDPWHVAQKFLHDNDLSQLFLDQVANFIIKNSEQAPIASAAGQFADPFTGGSRYIPASGTVSSMDSVQSNTSAAYSSPEIPGSPSYIPHTTYLKLEQANLSAILDKLREFNSKQPEESRVPEDKLESVVKLASGEISEESKSEAVRTLRLLLDWPDENVFPALDVARLTVLRKEGNDEICTEELLNTVRRHLKSDAIVNNQMLVFRLLANMFSHERGEKLCVSHKNELLQVLLGMNSLGSKSNQVAISTFILNTVVALNKTVDANSKTQYLNAIIMILPRLNEIEAVFRALVALGTLLCATTNPEERNLLTTTVRSSETAINVLKSMSETSISTPASNKVANCADQIINLL